MNGVDANVFIRYLIGDDPTKQEKSKELIDRIHAGQEAALTTAVIVSGRFRIVCEMRGAVEL